MEPTPALPAPSSPPADAPGSWLLGHIPAFHEDPIGLLQRAVAQHGPVVALRFAAFPAWVVAEPELVREVLVNADGAFVKGVGVEGFRPLIGKGILLAEGDAHKRQRRMMQPAFHKERIASYAAVMVEEIAAVDAAWAKAPGGAVDVVRDMNRLTLRIAARTLFGADLSDADIAAVGAAVEGFALYYHQTSHPLGPLLQHLPTDATRRMRAGRDQLHALLERLVGERKARVAAGGDPGTDILGMLLAARDEAGEPLTDEHVRDEALTLLIAGHETTGATLAWAFALLSANPAAADRVAAEAIELLGDRLPTAGDALRLKLAEAAFAETLRLYPSALALPRQAARDTTLGPWKVRKGTIVMCGVWPIHRDARWWPEPDRFELDRWTAEARAARPKYTFLPFSGGARVCIGEAFAWMEGTLTLAMLTRRWRVTVDPGHRIEPEALFTVRPKGGVPAVATPRAPAAGG